MRLFNAPVEILSSALAQKPFLLSQQFLNIFLSGPDSCTIPSRVSLPCPYFTVVSQTQEMDHG